MANIKLTAKEDKFVQAMNNSAGAVGRLSAIINFQLNHSLREADVISNRFQQGFGKLGDKIQSVGQTMSTYVTLPLTLMGGAALKAYGELDSLKKGLTTIEGTSANVEKRLVQLREAAKLPGLGFQEAIQGDIRLRAVGIAAETSMRILKEFGNANALTGGGKEKLSEIITQLTQMAAKGKVVAQDLKPIIEAAPSVSTAIKQLFGTVDSEAIQKNLTAAGKTSADFINDLLGALEKAPRVVGGWENAIENAKDNAFNFAASLGEIMNKSFDLEGKLNSFSDKLVMLEDWFKSLSPEVQKAILGFTGIIAVAGPLMVAVGGIIKGFSILFTGTLVLTGAITAIVAAVAVATLAFTDYVATKNKLALATRGVSDVEEEARKSIHEQGLAISAQKDILENANSTLAERKKAVKSLIDISPEYFGKLDGEKIKYDDLNIAVSKYITNLENASKANLLKSQIDLSIKTESEILANPAISTSEVEKTIEYTKQKLLTGVQSIMKGLGVDDSQVDFTNSLADKVALNAAQAVMKIRDARKPLEEELGNLFKLGYKPAEIVAPAASTNTAPPPSTLKPNWLAKLDIEEIKKQAIEQVSVVNETLRSTMSQYAESEFLKGQNGPFKISKIIDFTNSDFTDAATRLNTKFQKLFENVKFYPASATTKLSEEAKKFKDDFLMKFGTDLSEFPATLKKAMDMSQFLTGGVENAIEATAQAIGSGGGLKKVFSNIMGIVGDFMVALGKKLFTINTIITAALNGIGGPAGIALAIGLIVAGSALKSQVMKDTPRFAQGGMVTGPTFAMMGDNASGREMALPWEKTNVFAQAIAANMKGGGGGYSMVEVKVKGEDLYAVLQMHKKNNGY